MVGEVGRIDFMFRGPPYLANGSATGISDLSSPRKSHSHPELELFMEDLRILDLGTPTIPPSSYSHLHPELDFS